MIARITVEGLGPILRRTTYELGGQGMSRVTGPSEVGKTLGLIDATTFCLWGEDARGRAFPIEAISDEAESVEVELTLTSGTRLYRAMKRNRKQLRQVTNTEGTQEWALESAFQQAIGVLGADHELLRTIMVPHYWQTLALTNARPLRDLLARVMPPTDLRAVVLKLMDLRERTLRPHDPLLEPEAVEARRKQNSEVERADAGLLVAEKILAEEEAVELEAPALSRETTAAILESEHQWVVYDAAMQTRRSWEEWQNRREALGPRPKKSDHGPEYARVLELEELLKNAMTVHHALKEAKWQGDEVLARLKADIETKEAAVEAAGNGACPTCGRKWKDADEKRATARLALEHALNDYDMAKDKLEPERERFEETRMAELGLAETAVREAHEALKAARAEWESQRTEDPTAAWEKAFRALGSEPRMLGGTDNPPERPRPEPQTTLDALAARKAWSEYDGAVRARSTAAFRNTKRLDDARIELANAKAEAERLDVLVHCVRNAPSIIADEQREVLGDLGPVSIRFGRDPAVEILVDKRPFFLASTGKKLLADLYLRNAIRLASGMSWLPLFVDNVQDLSYELPAFPPQIDLRTEDRTDVQITAGTYVPIAMRAP